MSTVQRAEPPVHGKSAHKSWVARHKFLTAVVVLLLAVAIGGSIFAWPLVKLRFHPQYAAALVEIRSSKQVIDKLGEPIKPVRPFPGGTSYDDGNKAEARLVFSVEGPKGTADVVVDSSRLHGKWGFTQLKLTLPNKEEINLAAEIQNREGNDLPTFDPNAKPVDFKQPDLPLNIEVPQTPAK